MATVPETAEITDSEEQLASTLVGTPVGQPHCHVEPPLQTEVEPLKAEVEPLSKPSGKTEVVAQVAPPVHASRPQHSGDRVRLVVAVPVWVDPSAATSTVVAQAHAALATSLASGQPQLEHGHPSTLLDPSVGVGRSAGSGATVSVVTLPTAACDVSATPERTLVERPSNNLDLKGNVEVENAARSAGELLQVHLHALKEALGPKYIAVADTEAQVAERRLLIDSIHARLQTGELGIKKEKTTLFITKMEHELAQQERLLADQRREFARALGVYRDTARRTVGLLAEPMQATRDEYNTILEEHSPHNLNALRNTIETAVNTGPLAIGDRVTFLQGTEQTEAEVASAPTASGEYTVLVGQEERTVSFPFQINFTHTARLPRAQLYAPETPVRQPPAGPTALAQFEQRWGSNTGDVPPTDPCYLAELLATAQSVLPRFVTTVAGALARADLGAAAEFEPGPLKQPARIAQKAAEKYQGDYSRVLDLVRGTVVCADTAALSRAWTAVTSAQDLVVARVKNRLHPGVDATGSAGYRDVLLNVTHTPSGHVCEIQLTLRGLYRVKNAGGHAMYKVLRLVGRLEEWSCAYQGDASDVNAVDKLSDGAFSSCDVSGSSPGDVTARFAEVLARPQCYLTVLKLNFVTGLRSLDGTVLTEAVLRHQGRTLEVVEANNCGAGGAIPCGLRHCVRLKRLHLGMNRFDEGIPEWLAELRRLEFLNLESCGLSGPVPSGLGALTNLRILDLCSNELTGEIPPTLGGLARLSELHLGNNRLSGCVPESLGELSHLVMLTLFHNELSGSLPESLGRLTRLTKLSLSTNQLTGPIPSSFGGLAQLSMLSLFNNQFSGPIPESLGELTRLNHLLLSNNRLSGDIPPSLGKLTRLTKLSLFRNELSGSIPTSFSGLSQLTQLHLAYNQLAGDVPEELSGLSALAQLTLSGNQLSGHVPGWLGRLTELTKLTLSENALEGPIPESLRHLTLLTKLGLGGNRLTGQIPGGLGCCTGLTQLFLHNNGLTGEIPASLGKLINLRELDLYGNQLTGGIPPGLSSASRLAQLNLGQNQLTGPLPESLGNLTELTSLSLQRNKLDGPIPECVGQLLQLTYLDLSENDLSGPIPTSLGRLTQLEKLNLARNRLTGPIPASLGQLTGLVALSLAENELEGDVPEVLLSLARSLPP